VSEILLNKQNTEIVKKPRLQFIDMARSFAILLMLEGHFTGAGLANQYRNEDYILYNIWHNLHGLTSPLFFTVTGLVFVYLLTGTKSTEPFFQNSRVKKGFNRVSMLLFWGYIIQLNLWSVLKSAYYGTPFQLDWFAAFHVLQSIAFGIAFLLLVYGIHLLIKKGDIYWYYLIAALLVFIGYSQMKAYIQADELRIAGTSFKASYWPNRFPSFIQNMFYGKYSDFSFMRYSGYVLLGGMTGSIIRKYEHLTKKNWFGILFILIAVFLNVFIQSIFVQLDSFTEMIGLCNRGVYELNSTAFMRFGQVIGLIGILMLIDGNFKVKAPLFLKLGQNTLPIYVIHVIILYGGIFGVGLKPDVINLNLSPYAAIGVSIIAMISFTIMVKYIEPLEEFYNSVLSKIFFWRK
jgi:hypothetical protein